MADFLEKQITKKRTGANLLGINVDTRAGLTIGNPATEYMLNALEKIAQKAEKAEIDNAKQSFWLDIEERNLKLQNKLSDPNIYGNQESFEEAMKEIENQRKENEKLLAGNMYFTKDEKELAKKQLNNGSFNIYAKAMEKRNTVYTQQQVEKAVYEMDRLITIGSQLDMNDVESQKMIVDRVIAGTKTLQSLGNWTDERAMEYANRNMMAIEQGRFEKDLNNIISNPNLTLEQKQNKMKQIFDVGSKGVNITAMAQDYTRRLGYTGELAEKSTQLFEASLKQTYGAIKEIAYKNLERFEYNKEVERAKREREQKKINNIENQIRSYIIKRDTQKLTQLTTGKVYTTSEMVSDNKNLNNLYGKTILEFGDITNSAVPKIMNNGDKSELKDLIKRAKEDGLTEQNIANSVIYPYLNQLAGNDEYKLNALIKDFGTEGIKGFDVDTLLNGRKDPEYFNVSKKLNAGRGYELPDEDIDKIGNFYNNSRERYKALINSLGGDRKAKQAVDAYIKGAILNSTDEELSVYAEEVKKEVKEIMPDVFKIFLIDNDNYNEMRNNLERIRKREISPTLYKESNILMENFGIKELTFVDVPLETDDNFEVIGD